MSTAANLREKGEDLIHKVNIEKDFNISFDRDQNGTSVKNILYIVDCSLSLSTRFTIGPRIQRSSNAGGMPGSPNTEILYFLQRGD